MSQGQGRAREIESHVLSRFTSTVPLATLERRLGRGAWWWRLAMRFLPFCECARVSSVGRNGNESECWLERNGREQLCPLPPNGSRGRTGGAGSRARPLARIRVTLAGHVFLQRLNSIRAEKRTGLMMPYYRQSVQKIGGKGERASSPRRERPELNCTRKPNTGLWTPIAELTWLFDVICHKRP